MDEHNEDHDGDEVAAANHTLTAASNWNSGRQQFERYVCWMLKELDYASSRVRIDDTAQRLFGMPRDSISDEDIVWDRIQVDNINTQDLDYFAGWLYTHGTHLNDVVQCLNGCGKPPARPSAGSNNGFDDSPSGFSLYCEVAGFPDGIEPGTRPSAGSNNGIDDSPAASSYYNYEDHDDDDVDEGAAAANHDDDENAVLHDGNDDHNQDDYRDEVAAANHAIAASSQNAGSGNWNSGRQRFERFVRWTLKELDYDASSRVRIDDTAQRLFGMPRDSISDEDIVWDRIQADNINTQDLDYFAGWLYTHGTHLNDPNQQISWKTAECDISALLQQLVQKSMHKSDARFDGTKVKIIRAGMRKMFIRRAIERNESVVKSHKTSLEGDLIRIAMLCLWSNDIKLFSVAFFIVALCQFGGRSIETAGAAFSRVTMKQPEEFKGAHFEADSIPHFTLWRNKGFHEQELSIIHNRDFFLLCFPFLMFVSMMTSAEAGDYIFPDFQKKAGADTERTPAHTANESSEVEDGPFKSKTLTKYFKLCMNKVILQAEELDEHVAGVAARSEAGGNEEEEAGETLADVSFISRIMNLYGVSRYKFQPGLTCHSQKRYAVNEIIQSHLISFVTQAFRMGWVSKALHTVFHYADLSAAGDRQCARVLSRWSTAGLRGEYGGGRPPRLDCLKESNEMMVKIGKFNDFLFCSYSHVAGACETNLQLYLTATFLCRLGDFLDFLKHDPLQRYGTTTIENFSKHKLLIHVGHCAASALLTIDDLIECGKVIERDFYMRNYLWVPEEDLRRVRPRGDEEDGDVSGDANYGSDTRTIGAFLCSMEKHLRNLNTLWIDTKQQNCDLKAAMLQLSKNNCDLKGELIQLKGVMCQMYQHVSNGNANGMALPPLQLLAAPPAWTEPTGQAPTEQAQRLTIQQIPKSLAQLDCKMVFRNWYQCGYNHLQCGSKSVKSHVKFVVEYLNLFLDAHIQREPTGSHPEQIQWRINLSRTTEEVWVKAQDFVKRIANQDLSDKLSSFKGIMYKCDHNRLPSGPAGICLYQPDTDPLRNKEGLIRHKELQQERSKKRKAVDAVDDGGIQAAGDNGSVQAQESTEPSLSERVAAENAQKQWPPIRRSEENRSGGIITTPMRRALYNERFSDINEFHPRESNLPLPQQTFASADEGHRGVSVACRPNDDIDDYDS